MANIIIRTTHNSETKALYEVLSRGVSFLLPFLVVTVAIHFYDHFQARRTEIDYVRANAVLTPETCAGNLATAELLP